MLSASRFAFDIGPEEFWTLRPYLNDQLADLRTAIERGDTVGAAATKLDEIVTFLRFHFAIEERIMAEVGERNLAHHAAEHRAFLEDLSALQRVAREPVCCLTPGICDEIDAWLRSHFVKYDTTLETTVALVHHPERTVDQDIAAYLTRVACFA